MCCRIKRFVAIPHNALSMRKRPLSRNPDSLYIYIYIYIYIYHCNKKNMSIAQGIDFKPIKTWSMPIHLPTINARHLSSLLVCQAKGHKILFCLPLIDICSPRTCIMNHTFAILTVTPYTSILEARWLMKKIRYSWCIIIICGHNCLLWKKN